MKIQSIQSMQWQLMVASSPDAAADCMREALHKSDGAPTEACKVLGISHTGWYRYARVLGIADELMAISKAYGKYRGYGLNKATKASP